MFINQYFTETTGKLGNCQPLIPGVHSHWVVCMQANAVNRICYLSVHLSTDLQILAITSGSQFWPCSAQLIYLCDPQQELPDGFCAQGKGEKSRGFYSAVGLKRVWDSFKVLSEICFHFIVLPLLLFNVFVCLFQLLISFLGLLI